jgi:hypothetical protein
MVDEYIPKTLHETLLDQIAVPQSIHPDFPEEIPTPLRHRHPNSCLRVGMPSAPPYLASQPFLPGCIRIGPHRGDSGYKQLSSANSAIS